MNNAFIQSFQSEWIKTRRSSGSWLVIIGGFFIPLITLIISLTRPEQLPGFYKSLVFWETSFNNQWQSMALFLLPMGVILASSLITQIEYRNNTWKLVHALPQRFSILFFAKLSVILVMMLQFFVLFNIGIYVVSIIPAMLLSEVSFPVDPYPFLKFLKINALFYLDCLPIIAMQYLISLRFKNFMVPIGVGLGLIVATMFAVQWKYGYTIPYTYTSFYFLSLLGEGKVQVKENVHLWAAAYFVGITALSYVIYRTRKEIG